MDRLDVVAISDAINASASPRQAWERFSAVLAQHGLQRASLHAGMPLAAKNPFHYDACKRAFGRVWEANFDRRVRGYLGDLRQASAAEFRGFRPALDYLARARQPLLIDHRTIATGAQGDEAAALSRDMMERFGQYQALILPLADPSNGTVALLSVWGDEDRDDFTRFAAENLSVLHLAGLYFLAMIEARWPLESSRFNGDHASYRPLSSRERQVLAHIAAGAQTAEIADRLHISDRSVREYLARAKQKLSARTRSDAVARAIMDGLL
jgi:DNA-binding CsgD family transcriptional regulator